MDAAFAVNRLNMEFAIHLVADSHGIPGGFLLIF